jgi:TonB family protein
VKPFSRLQRKWGNAKLGFVPKGLSAMRVCVFLCLLVPSFAWARAEPIAAVPVVSSRAMLEPESLMPDEPICAMPADARAVANRGATVLSVHIMRDGRVKNSRLVESSGAASLDAAAIRCIGAVQLTPKTKNGQPVEVDWDMEVVWPRGNIESANVEGSPEICNPFDASHVMPKSEGETLVSFVIEPDGSVGETSVVESSGNTALDSAAADCVSHFRYRPALEDGKPVAIDGSFVANWRRGGGR